MKSIPRPVWIGLAVALLLAAPLAFVSPPEPASGEKALEPRQEEALQGVVSLIRGGDLTEARRRIDQGFGGAGSPMAWSRLLEALQVRHQTEITRDGLALYGELLMRHVQAGFVYRDFRFHLRRLRHQALLKGGRPLLAEVADRIFRHRDLPAYAPEVIPDIVEHAVLFERWDEALAAFQEIPADWLEPAAAPLENLYLPLRQLVRIASAGRDPAARDEFRELRESLGDDLAVSAERRRRIATWLQGVEQFYAPEAHRDRGVEFFESAVDAADLAPVQLLFRIDLARALREEARVRAASLREDRLPAVLADEPDGSGLGGRRARHLFRIGWGAVRLGDHDELEAVLEGLAPDVARKDVATYHDLLTGCRLIQDGESSAGRERIREAVERAGPVLADAERADWLRVAETGRLPGGDPGVILFETGKLWGELPEHHAWVTRTLERLRGRIRSPRDQAFFSYLVALDDFRHDRLAEARQRLLGLLEEEMPPGLTRGEVAWLLVFAEKHEEELRAIDNRRQRASELLEEVLSVEGQGLSGGTLARILSVQVNLERGGTEYLETEEGRARFAEVGKELTAPWLESGPMEQWLELEEELLDLVKARHLAGDLEAALATLGHLRGLGRDLPEYQKTEGRIRWSMAQRAELARPDTVEENRERWVATARVFEAVGRASFGDPECYFDAGEAYLRADALEDAFRAFDLYIPRRRETDETRYWWTLRRRAHVLRRLGKLRDAISLIDSNMDAPSLDPHRPALRLERGLAREALGDTDGAIEDYSEIYVELVPPNPIWLEALYRRAQLLQKRAESPPEDAPPGVSPLELALTTWEELAARIADSQDPRLAEALFYSGEGRMITDQPEEARVHFSRLASAAERALTSPRRPEDREIWERYWQKGLFALADAWFELERYAEAERVYEQAVHRFAASPMVPWGHHQLGECAVRGGNIEEAIRRYQLGIRKVKELPEPVVAQLPFDRGRQFWLRNFEEKIRLLENTKGNG